MLFNSPIRLALILVIMSVLTFKTDFILYLRVQFNSSSPPEQSMSWSHLHAFGIHMFLQSNSPSSQLVPVDTSIFYILMQFVSIIGFDWLLF